MLMPPTPPVTASQCTAVNSTMKCAASVAIARYKPLSLSEGMPKIMPATAATIPEAGQAIKNGTLCAPRKAVA